jgi:hypothetical protein
LQGRSSSPVGYGIGIAEVVGSNPTRSIFVNLVVYYIVLRLCLGGCRTNSCSNAHAISYDVITKIAAEKDLGFLKIYNQVDYMVKV